MVIVHAHEIDIPHDLVISVVGEVVIAYDSTHRFALSIFPVTRLPASTWMSTRMFDGSVEVHLEDVVVGAHRCRRVIALHPTFRRIVLFVETRDGTNGWLPLVLVARDACYDDVLEAAVASVRATRAHPLQMWLE